MSDQAVDKHISDHILKVDPSKIADAADKFNPKLLSGGGYTPEFAGGAAISSSGLFGAAPSGGSFGAAMEKRSAAEEGMDMMMDLSDDDAPKMKKKSDAKGSGLFGAGSSFGGLFGSAAPKGAPINSAMPPAPGGGGFGGFENSKKEAFSMPMKSMADEMR